MDALTQLKLHLSCTDLDAQFRVERALEMALRWHRQNVQPGDRNLYDAAVAHVLAHLNEVAVVVDDEAETEAATLAS
jgi:hypothetical protein